MSKMNRVSNKILLLYLKDARKALLNVLMVSSKKVYNDFISYVDNDISQLEKELNNE